MDTSGYYDWTHVQFSFHIMSFGGHSGTSRLSWHQYKLWGSILPTVASSLRCFNVACLKPQQTSLITSIWQILRLTAAMLLASKSNKPLRKPLSAIKISCCLPFESNEVLCKPPFGRTKLPYYFIDLLRCFEYRQNPSRNLYLEMQLPCCLVASKSDKML